MNWTSGLRISLREMASHRLRTSLTVMGVVLGVATFVTLFSLLEGDLEKSRMWLSESGGLEKVSIWGQGLKKEERLKMRPNRSRGITLGDYRALQRSLDLVTAVAPGVNGKGAVKRAGKESEPNIHGVTDAVLGLDRYEVARGRFICDLDQIHHRMVCVLGSKPVEELFGNEDPLGKTVTIEGLPLIVVGVLKKHSLMYGKWNAFEWKNEICYVPLTTYLARGRGNDRIDYLSLRVLRTERMAWALDQARNLLLWRHGVEDFKIQTQQEWAENSRKQEIMITVILGIIAGICLLSGGVGIMNIMLASIKERTREIGVRRALGARRGDILTQFILEALALGIMGGLVGVLAGAGLVGLLTLLPEQAAVMHFKPVAFAFLSAVLICLSFGIYPAWRASRLDPIEALRND